MFVSSYIVMVEMMQFERDGVEKVHSAAPQTHPNNESGDWGCHAHVGSRETDNKDAKSNEVI